MLVPDIEVGRLSLINCWNYATTKQLSFHGVAPFYLTDVIGMGGSHWSGYATSVVCTVAPH